MVDLRSTNASRISGELAPIPDPRSSVLIRGKVFAFAFPITRDVGDHKFAAPQTVHRERAAQPGVERSKTAKPTLQPSACVPSASDPTPHSVLLKTKAKVQFERTVDRLSKPFFCRFCQSNRCHFAGHFTLVTLCQRIDRQWVATFRGLLG
jgi:hypothetical protein